MLLVQGQAYSNFTGTFNLSNDPKINGLSCYPTQYKSLVYDSNISGAIIPTGLYVSGTNTFLNVNSGLILDYINGRALATGSYPNGFTGAAAKVEYNIYTTATDSLEAVLETLYGGNPDLALPTTGVSPLNYNAPCIILTLDNSRNDPFSFGGFDTTTATARAYIISQNRWGQTAVASIFRDTNLQYIPIITGMSDIPLDYYNNLKTGYFNYQTNVISKYNQPQYWSFIREVKASSISEQKNRNRTILLSYLEFTLDTIRLPRQPGPQF